MLPERVAHNLYLDETLEDYLKACNEESSLNPCSSEESDEEVNQCSPIHQGQSSMFSGSACNNSRPNLKHFAPLKLHHVSSTDRTTRLEAIKNVSENEEVACDADTRTWRVSKALSLPLEAQLSSLNDSARVDGEEAPSAAHASSFIPEDERHLRYLLALEEIQHQILFDALCALRHSGSNSFECTSATKTCHKDGSSTEIMQRWRMRKAVKKELTRLNLHSFIYAIKRILNIANDLMELKEENERFRRLSLAASKIPHLKSVCVYSLGSDIGFADFEAEDGIDAIGCAGYAVLSRFSRLITTLMDEFFIWVSKAGDVLRRQQEVRKKAPFQESISEMWNQVRQFGSNVPSKLSTEEFLRKAENWAHCVPFLLSLPRKNTNGSSPRISKLGENRELKQINVSEAVLAIEENVVTLRLWWELLNRTQCFNRFCNAFSSVVSNKCMTSSKELPSEKNDFSYGISKKQFALESAKQAAVLLDDLVVRSTMLQGTASFGTYRHFIALAVDLSWPFIDLCTAAMYGFVRSADEIQWRQILPRMFRISFSHYRLPGSEPEHSLDVLSLILNCLGYRSNVSEIFEERKAVGPEGEGTVARNELSYLFAARRFIVQSFCQFAQQKKQWHPPSSPVLFDLLRDTSPENDTGEPEFYSLPLSLAVAHHDDHRIKGKIPPLDEDVKKSEHSEEGNYGVKSWPPALNSHWSLVGFDSGTSVRLELVNVATSSCENSAVPKPELWISTHLPGARWLASGLLVPFGLAVQQLHQRRLKDLYRTMSIPIIPSTQVGKERLVVEWKRSFIHQKGHIETDDQLPGRVLAAKPGLKQAHPAKTTSSTVHPSKPLSTGRALTFTRALRLIMDVALCCCRDHILNGFLNRLYASGHWWARDAAGISDERSYLVSSIFAESIQGIPHGELVQLVVLPPMVYGSSKKKYKSQLSATACDPILEAFASFQLQFSFPDELSLILLPAQLSLMLNDSRDQLQNTYHTLFWYYRRGLRVDNELSDDASTLDSNSSSLPFADVWSYVFGYLCALHYVQISLRDQRKMLLISDAHAHEMERNLVRVNPEIETQRNIVSRGVGSMYYALSFAIDTLLSFTMHEVHTVVYELETTFFQKKSFSSVRDLCRQLDGLLFNLQLVSFPSLIPFCASKSERASLSDSGEIIRTCVTDLLHLALDPTRFSLPTVTVRNKNAVEKLVSEISSNSMENAMLHRCLKPLLTMLTFNRFYGEGLVLYQFR